MKSTYMILFGLFVAIKAGAEGEKPAWSYNYETQWQGYCRTGTRQSPINIMTRDATEDKFGAHIRGPLRYQGYDRVNMQAYNNEHTLKWDTVEYPDAPVLSGGPLRGNYTLRQFHLHWLSEHALDGMKYPLEIHFVHVKQGLTTEEALMLPDGITVIGVMGQVQAGAYSGLALKEIMNDVPNLINRGARPEYNRTVDLTRFFSPDPQSYFTYHGSLTTPGCQEVVTWIVMEKPVAISDEQFHLISKVDVGTINNFRSLQPVNRVVYRVRSNTASSCSQISASTILITLGALVNCFGSHLSKALKRSICILYNSKKKFFGGASNLPECAKILN